MQVIYNLFVPNSPRHVTTLARFSALQHLRLSGLEGLKPDEVRLVGQHPDGTSATHLQTMYVLQLAKFGMTVCPVQPNHWLA